jgi:hypothetical protein
MDDPVVSTRSILGFFGSLIVLGTLASQLDAWPGTRISPTNTGNGVLSAPATLNSTSGYALTINTSGTDADNRGLQIQSTWSGTSGVGYALHILMSAAATVTAYALKLGCVNSLGPCRALETSDGLVKFNTQSGDTVFSGDVTIAPVNSVATKIFTLGLGGTANLWWNEKHNTSPTFGASCTTGGSSVAPVDNKWSDFTLGASATFPCVITFAAPGPFANAPTCDVSAKVGSNQTALSWTTSTSALTLSAGTAGASYVMQCGGH